MAVSLGARRERTAEAVSDSCGLKELRERTAEAGSDSCGLKELRERTAEAGSDSCGLNRYAVRATGDCARRTLTTCSATQDFRKLHVWEKSHLLALEIHRIAGRFPRADGLALTSRLRRSTLWIPSNLAEGAGKSSDIEFRRFRQIALGSASECQYHLMVARELKLIIDEPHHQLRDRMAEVRRMLTGLSKKLSTTASAPK